MALLFLLLAAFTGVQTAAEPLIHPHGHGRAGNHCCGICHTGHFPLAPAMPGLAVDPPVACDWHPPAEPAPLVCDRPAASNPSRAPPA
jgi:hypothetical protein